MFSGLLDKYRACRCLRRRRVVHALLQSIRGALGHLEAIFTRLLTTDAYGTYSLYTSWCMLFSLVVTLNLASEVFNKWD